MLTRPVRHEAEATMYEAEAGHVKSTSRLKITGWPESRRKKFGD